MKIFLALAVASLLACAAKQNIHSTLLAAAIKAPLTPVYFAAASDELSDATRTLLNQYILWLQAHPQHKLVLEGHCDERGSEVFNLELGDKRARQVKSYLLTQGLLSQQRISIISYGETKPKNKSHTPQAWQENRRVEFKIPSAKEKI